MPQQDYFKRHIELLGRVLGKILFNSLGFKTGADINEKLDKVHQQIKSEVDLDVYVLMDKPFDVFTEMVENETRWNDENLSALADILISMAEIIDNQELFLTKKLKLQQFALNILQYINKRSLIYAYDRNKKIEKLLKEINQ